MHEIDFNSPEFTDDPYPFYAQLRGSAEPYFFAHERAGSHLKGMWLISRYDEVAAAIKESSAVSKQLIRLRTAESITPMDTTMLNQDPPDHTRLRALVSQAFTPGQINKLAPRIQWVVDTLLTRFKQEGGGDFVQQFAIPLPMMVIADFMGVPFEDHKLFLDWAERILQGYDSGVKSDDGYKSYLGAIVDMGAYFEQLIEKRKAQPTDDLISRVIEAREKHDKLSGEELLSMCMLLLVSAHETTTNMLSSGMYSFFNNPDQWEKLRREPEHLESAVEEILRYESPIQRATFRITTREYTLGGKTFTQGEQIVAILGAANRDPAQFPDPDRFDITRTPNRHLAFGLGIHFCLGAFLARTEGRLGFGSIMAQLPTIHRASGELTWNGKKLFRGLATLPVAL